MEMDPETRTATNRAKQVYTELYTLQHPGSLIGYLWAQYAHGTPRAANRCVIANYIKEKSGVYRVYVEYDHVEIHHNRWVLQYKTPPHFRKVMELFDTNKLNLLETPPLPVRSQAECVLAG